MKINHSILLILTGLFIFSGCYHAQITTDREPSAQVYEDKMASGFLFGLVPPSIVRAQDECPNGIAKVETQRSFLNGLLSAITFNIYTPMHIKVTCASSSADVSADRSDSETINREDSDVNTAEPQVQEGDIKAGIGLVYGSGVSDFGSLDNNLGIRVDGYYAITEVIRGGGDFTYYFPKSEDGVDFKVWELNFNGNYIFVDEDGLLVYALAGFNITGTSFDSSFSNINESNSGTEVGLNLGGGIEYGLDFADFFGEAKLGGLGGDANQFVIGAGLRFPISP